MSLTVQYSIIFALFILAMVVLVRRFLPSKKGQNSCGTNCKCEAMDTPEKG